MLAEILISLGILGLLMGGLTLAGNTSRKANAILLTRQACVAAAQAHLEALASTGKPVAPDEARRLWPNVRVTLAADDGQGQWEGLKLVTASATGTADGREVKVELARYYNRAVEVKP